MSSSVSLGRGAALVAVAAAAASLAPPASLAAQSAEEIFLTALDRHEKRMEGIEHYTVVQEVMGLEASVTFHRSEVEGRTVFLPAGEQEAGPGALAGFHGAYPKIAERAAVRGKESVEGVECWIIELDDFGGLDLGREMAMGDQGDFVPKSVALYLDTRDYLIRKIGMEGEITSNGQTRLLTAEISLTDYRDVDGLLHPFTMTLSAAGVSTGMSEKEAEETRASLAQMEEQLAAMDASQRAMVERMMGPRIEELRKMLTTGTFEITATTKEVRVNE
jgi:hypothetical protein